MMRFVWRILSMTGQALGFAVLAGGIYALGRYCFLRARRRETDRKREGILLLLVVYLAALLHITVIRGGVLTLERGTVQLVPLYYTVMELKRGILAFLYPVLGNIGWFLPYGVLIPLAMPKWRKLGLVTLSGAGLSFCIEVLQWVLGSGVSDIDDVIFNALGAALGFLLLRARFPGK